MDVSLWRLEVARFRLAKDERREAEVYLRNEPFDRRETEPGIERLFGSHALVNFL